MLKAMAAAALGMALSGAAFAQSSLTPPPSAQDPGPTATRPYQLRPPAGESAAEAARRRGRVDLNNNRATGRGREQGSGTLPQRLGPISPGTGAHDSGVPDSSTYNPATPAIR